MIYKKILIFPLIELIELQTIFSVIILRRKFILSIIITAVVLSLMYSIKSLYLKKDTVPKNGVFVKGIDYYECKNATKKLQKTC